MSIADFDPYKLSSPRIFLLRMTVFVVLAAFLALILYEQIIAAFLSNPGLNGLIIGVLLIGVVLAFRQVVRLFPEVNWVNSFRVADPGLALRDAPVLLAPMASILGNRLGRAAISTMTLRSILDSVGTRLDEARDIGRYLTSLLVFLGLLGTFWGLLETVGSIGGVIQSLNVSGDAAVVFEDLKSGLAAPLGGMGLAFSSSLFGLAGSLVLGFLDLQAGQAQNRFYNELEDWLSATVNDGQVAQQAPAQDGFAMAELTQSIQSLVQHMRSEQQIVRDWMENQAQQQRDMAENLARVSAAQQTAPASAPAYAPPLTPPPAPLGTQESCVWPA